MNLLMVLAAAGAIGVGRASDAGVLLFLFSLSTSLESLAMVRTRSAIEHLVRLRPSQAIRLRNGDAEKVAVEALEIGDLIRIPAFESIPADAVVTEGQSSIDASTMTGEAIPVPCGIGDKVVGGTQNLDGPLVARVSAVVGDSALDQIVHLVGEAQENKASGERVSQWFGQTYTVFVLIAFAVSLIVRIWIGEQLGVAFYASLTLLVGLSPCALVISTPATTLSALTWCARNGILVRGGEYVERAGNIRIVALDKTGTLTEGRPSLRWIAQVEPDREELCEWHPGEPTDEPIATTLSLAASAEGDATHPLAIALVRAAHLAGEVSSASNSHTVPGLGVSASVREEQIWVGRARLLSDSGIQVPKALTKAAEDAQKRGLTVSYVAHGATTAAFGFADSVREGAAGFIRDLRNLGIDKVVLLTGDRQETADSVVEGLGLDVVSAGLMPGQKTEEIERLSKNGSVMMVGDGINDAPSLAGAAVGVAMGGLGSDVALNAADVVLMRDRLESVVDLIALGRRTTAAVRFNLFFAGSVIVLLALSSLSGRLPLPIAVVGHEGSTVLVILNGLRMLNGPLRHSRAKGL